MDKERTKLRVAFVHPDLGIGGAERLVVDTALGLKELGHIVDIYTSHHDPTHCFEETRDGSLRVHPVKSPFPRAINGKFHVLFAHLRQLHLTCYLLLRRELLPDVFFVDQVSTCVPLLRLLGHTRVVFYCHFPDKLLVNGEFLEGRMARRRGGLLKRLYRLPMDWLEEFTTRQADVILSNSKFTARIFMEYFPSITQTPRIVYPGIKISAYETGVDNLDPAVASIIPKAPSLLSLNRFESKKNIRLAIQTFVAVRSSYPQVHDDANLRLILAGGYDPRLEDNVKTLTDLLNLATSLSLTYDITSNQPVTLPPDIIHTTAVPGTAPHVLFLLNFSTAQRSALLQSPDTRALLYTPANEHFGIVPIEAMACGLPILACDSGGPTESVVDAPYDERTGWLLRPDAMIWAGAVCEILQMSASERVALANRGRQRARELFSSEAMVGGVESALEKAVAMGRVESALGTWAFILLGFVTAYFAASFTRPW